jgi:hypothetical protein
MSYRSEDFADIAKAEKQLCDEAGPLLAAIIRAVEARAGLAITEVRVTLDRSDNSSSPSTANCTIIRADSPSPSRGRDIQRSTPSTEASRSGLFPNQE